MKNLILIASVVTGLVCGNAMACYCNDTGEVQGELYGDSCSTDYTCKLFKNDSTVDGYYVQCGQNGCSGEISTGDCYCLILIPPIKKN